MFSFSILNSPLLPLAKIHDEPLATLTMNRINLLQDSYKAGTHHSAIVVNERFYACDKPRTTIATKGEGDKAPWSLTSNLADESVLLPEPFV